MLILPEPWGFFLNVIIQTFASEICELLLRCGVRGLYSYGRFRIRRSPPQPVKLALLYTLLEYRNAFPEQWLRPEGPNPDVHRYFLEQACNCLQNPRVSLASLSDLPTLIAFCVPPKRVSPLPVGYREYNYPDRQKVIYKEQIILKGLRWELETPICTQDNANCLSVEVGELALKVHDLQKFAEYFLGNTIYIEEDTIKSDLRLPIVLALNTACQRVNLEQINTGRPEFLMQLLSDGGINEMLELRGFKLESIHGLNLRISPDEEIERWRTRCLQVHARRSHLVNAEELSGWRPTNNSNHNNGVLWSAGIGPQNKILGAIASLNGHLCFCSTSGCIFVMERNGTFKYFQTSGRVSFEAGPVVWKNKLVVVSREGHVLCFSPEVNNNQLQLWTPYRADRGFCFRNEPIIHNDAAYLACCGIPSGVIRVDNLDNECQRFTPVFHAPDRDVICGTPFLCPNGTLLVVTERGRLYRLDPVSNNAGEIFAPGDANGSNGHTIGGPVCDKGGRYVFFCHQDYGLVTIDLFSRTGFPQMPDPALGRASTMPILVADHRGQITAYAATENGYLLARKATNANAAEHGIRISDTAIHSRLAIWKHLLFAVDDRGTIHAINLDTRAEWWSYRTDHRTRAPIWIDEDTGIIVVASQDGSLTALRWYLDKPQEGIELLERWGDCESAANLAFVYKDFEKARTLWRQAQSQLGLAILAECDGQIQAAIAHYSTARENVRQRNPSLVCEIDEVIRELEQEESQQMHR